MTLQSAATLYVIPEVSGVASCGGMYRVPTHTQVNMQYRSRIHERTISLRFLGIILRVVKHEVSVHNVYITNKFRTTFNQGGRGVKPLVEVTE